MYLCLYVWYDHTESTRLLRYLFGVVIHHYKHSRWNLKPPWSVSVCVCVIGRNLVTISCLFIFSTHKRFVVAFLRIYVWRRGLLAICCCWGVSVSWHFRDFHHIYMDVVCGDHGRRHNLLSLTDNAQRSVDDVFKWRSRFNALLIGDTINFLLYHIQRVFVCVHLFLCIVLVA